jgi:hypothetical protein
MRAPVVFFASFGAKMSRKVKISSPIAIESQRIDRTHTAAVGAWRISFGAAPQWATFPKTGMALNGLRCGHSGLSPSACSLFMAIRQFESRASACRIRQAGQEEKIACPQEIHFAS